MADPTNRTQTAGMNRAARSPVMVGPPRQTAMWLWACVSAGMHVALFLGFASFGPRGAGLFGGRGIADGDGFGGTSVELEIAGPDDDVARGAPSAGSMPSIPAPIPAQEGSAPPEKKEVAPMLEGELPVRRREAIASRPSPAVQSTEQEEEAATPTTGNDAREALHPLPSRDLPNRDDPTRERVAAPGNAEESSGTDAEDSTAGAPAGDPGALILGSAGALGDAVTARRALLPNGGVCSDPVAGVWRAQKYRGSDQTWVRFMLRIRRTEGDALTGTITSRIWRGNPSNPMPGRCEPGGFDHTWRMEARGEVDGTRVRFGSREVRLIQAHCPASDTRYAPDRFDGTVEPLSETYRSVNNDGWFDIDEPYTFRRISCE